MATTMFSKHITRPKPDALTANDGKVDLTKEFHNACRRGEANRLKYIISQSSDDHVLSLLNSRENDNGLSGLSTAIARGHRNIALYLISLDVDIELQDYNNWSPLHWAIHSGSIELACHLIRAGAKVTNDIIQLAINQRFGLIDMFIHSPTNNTPQQQLDKMKQIVMKARVDNAPQDVDILFSIISPTFTQKQHNIWNFYLLIKQHQQCVDFAAKCLKEEPLPAEFGTVSIDAQDEEDDERTLFASDSSDSDS